MTISLFCDECGALLSALAVSCPVCGQLIQSASPTLSTPLNPPEPLPPPIKEVPPSTSNNLLHDRYRLLKQIGQGGFATVYSAIDYYRRHKPVAIKQIHLSTLSPQEMIEATDSYNREVSILSRLEHENLVRVHDHFTDSAHWYIVMEYIEGETLEDRLKKVRGGRLPLEQVIEIGILLCNVLGYLHAHNPPLIFRDVKPENIMITPKGRLYLIDFGIARRYRPGQSRDTGPLGSPGYAAPEQYGGAQTTAQTDIYGLGATLQTLLTGKDPLEIRISEKPPHVPKLIQPLLERMLKHNAQERPFNTHEVRIHLQRLKEQLPGKRTQRTVNTIRKFLFSMQMELALFVLGFFYFVYFSSDLLTTFYWPLWVISSVLIVIGRSYFYIHEESEETGSRLKIPEMLAIAWQRLPGSLMGVLLAGLSIYCLYDIQNAHSSLYLGDLFVIMMGITVLFFWLKALLGLFPPFIKLTMHRTYTRFMPPSQRAWHSSLRNTASGKKASYP
jgi:serine/threonine protein kinase